MNRFYVEKNQINNETIIIYGSDVNHIKNVLRLGVKDKVMICDGEGYDYLCDISKIDRDEVVLNIIEKKHSDTELEVRMYLFQGLPKKDKMELIIQKAVELGAYEVVPVVTRRTIVKIEDSKKEAKKLERWQSIATSAAKQSHRGIIPKVHRIVSFEEALKMSEELDTAMIPFEHADGIEASMNMIKNAAKSSSTGVFIGPEGGFEDEEVSKAMTMGVMPVTLGRRILRTETAGMTTLSLIMFEAEAQN